MLTNFPVWHSFAKDGVDESAGGAFALGPRYVDYVQSIEGFRLYQGSAC